MSRRAGLLLHSLGLAGLLALAACGGGGGGNNLAAIDNELVANGVDPALTSALEDQLAVDNNLNQQANPNSARPPRLRSAHSRPTRGRQSGGARAGAPRAAAPLSPQSEASCAAPRYDAIVAACRPNSRPIPAGASPSRGTTM